VGQRQAVPVAPASPQTQVQAQAQAQDEVQVQAPAWTQAQLQARALAQVQAQVQPQAQAQMQAQAQRFLPGAGMSPPSAQPFQVTIGSPSLACSRDPWHTSPTLGSAPTPMGIPGGIPCVPAGVSFSASAPRPTYQLAAPHPAPPPSNGYVSGVTTTSQASRAPPQADLEGPWRALRGLGGALRGLGRS